MNYTTNNPPHLSQPQVPRAVSLSSATVHRIIPSAQQPPDFLTRNMSNSQIKDLTVRRTSYQPDPSQYLATFLHPRNPIFTTRATSASTSFQTSQPQVLQRSPFAVNNVNQTCDGCTSSESVTNSVIVKNVHATVAAGASRAPTPNNMAIKILRDQEKCRQQGLLPSNWFGGTITNNTNISRSSTQTWNPCVEAVTSTQQRVVAEALLQMERSLQQPLATPSTAATYNYQCGNGPSAGNPCSDMSRAADQDKEVQVPLNLSRLTITGNGNVPAVVVNQSTSNIPHPFRSSEVKSKVYQNMYNRDTGKLPYQTEWERYVNRTSGASQVPTQQHCQTANKSNVPAQLANASSSPVNPTFPSQLQRGTPMSHSIGNEFRSHENNNNIGPFKRNWHQHLNQLRPYQQRPLNNTARQGHYLQAPSPDLRASHVVPSMSGRSSTLDRGGTPSSGSSEEESRDNNNGTIASVGLNNGCHVDGHIAPNGLGMAETLLTTTIPSNGGSIESRLQLWAVSPVPDLEKTLETNTPGGGGDRRQQENHNPIQQQHFTMNHGHVNVGPQDMDIDPESTSASGNRGDHSGRRALQNDNIARKSQEDTSHQFQAANHNQVKSTEKGKVDTTIFKGLGHMTVEGGLADVLIEKLEENYIKCRSMVLTNQHRVVTPLKFLKIICTRMNIPIHEEQFYFRNEAKNFQYRSELYITGFCGVGHAVSSGFSSQLAAVHLLERLRIFFKVRQAPMCALFPGARYTKIKTKLKTLCETYGLGEIEYPIRSNGNIGFNPCASGPQYDCSCIIRKQEACVRSDNPYYGSVLAAKNMYMNFLKPPTKPVVQVKDYFAIGAECPMLKEIHPSLLLNLPSAQKAKWMEENDVTFTDLCLQEATNESSHLLRSQCPLARKKFTNKNQLLTQLNASLLDALEWMEQETKHRRHRNIGNGSNQRNGLMEMKNMEPIRETVGDHDAPSENDMIIDTP